MGIAFHFCGVRPTDMWPTEATWHTRSKPLPCVREILPVTVAWTASVSYPLK